VNTLKKAAPPQFFLTWTAVIMLSISASSATAIQRNSTSFKLCRFLASKNGFNRVLRILFSSF